MAGETQGEKASCHVHVQVTPGQRAWLEARATAEGRSLGSVVRRMIENARQISRP